jgi:secondary thiamine-phosphate synthase enzyme
MMETIEVKTGQYVEFVEITAEVKQFVQRTGIGEGICVVYTPHTTAGITINENADPDVTADITAFLKKRYPRENYFAHMEGNTPSHIMSSLFGASETLIIHDGRLQLGRWQGIYFGEFDGPRTRKVILKALRG